MRLVTTVSIIFLASALASQSSACDRHGGMFGQMDGAGWTDYNFGEDEFDSLFIEQQITEWHKQNPVAPAEVKPEKPSFSKASTRASMAAQARLAKRAKAEPQDKAQPSAATKTDKTPETASR